MSNAQEKIKSSTRRHRDEVAVKKQLKIAKSHGMTNAVNDKLATESHRLSKHHAMDCGVPHCPTCGNIRHNKAAKTKDKLTKQEQSFYQDLDDFSHKHNNGLINKEDE